MQMLRQREWGVQNEFTKNPDLLLTISFSWKFNFSVRTSYK